MTLPTNELKNLPNLGKTLVDKLLLIGIENAEQLKATGAESVFIKLKALDNDACINMLYAIEGAIQGIRWHNLNELRKAELREFFRITNK